MSAINQIRLLVAAHQETLLRRAVQPVARTHDPRNETNPEAHHGKDKHHLDIIC